MKITRRKSAIAVAGLFTGVIILVLCQLPQSQSVTSRLHWEGHWRGWRVVLREQEIYIADSSMMAQRFRYRQLGPVRVERGPYPMP
jgi:hypothetical protein